MDFEEMTKEQLIQIIKRLQADCILWLKKYNDFKRKIRKVTNENE